MKTINILFTLLFFFFVPVQTYAEERGIKFFEGTWAEALQAAKEENKLIFVDVYTDWCPPCKKMDKEVLPLPEVGERYNEMFINFKLDAEKGEGPDLAEQYEVRAYPTYLYLDSEGNPLHRAVGYFSPSAFLAHTDQVDMLVDDEHSLAKFNSAFERGERDRDFLRNYIKKRKELGLNNDEVMNVYFFQLSWEDLDKTEELEFLAGMMNGTNNNALQFLMQNFGGIAESTQRVSAPNLFSLLIESSANSIKADNPLASKQSLDFAEKLLPHVGKQEQRRFYLYGFAYQKAVKDTSGIKKGGKALTGNLMEIPLDTIYKEDARRYEEVIAPFKNGEQDSTQIEDFEEQKKFIKNIYSREISSDLYEAAKTYSESLAENDPALRDALKWATRCDELMPNTQAIKELIIELKAQLAKE